MNEKQIMAKIERSSLGTTKAAAARRTVTDEHSRRIVARAAKHQATPARTRKSGG